MKLATAALMLTFLLPALACAPVRPWQRARLASPAMEQGLGESGFAGTHRSKVLESKTGGGLPASAPGGGCGCTQ